MQAMDQQVLHRFHVLGEDSRVRRLLFLAHLSRSRRRKRKGSSSRRSSASRAPASSKRWLDREGGSEPAWQLGEQQFNLPESVVEAIPQIGERDTAIVMHNDGVMQGLSEIPFMQDVKTLGRADDRYGPWQRPLQQPQR
jgi:hypothetical protein